MAESGAIETIVAEDNRRGLDFEPSGIDRQLGGAGQSPSRPVRTARYAPFFIKFDPARPPALISAHVPAASKPGDAFPELPNPAFSFMKIELSPKGPLGVAIALAVAGVIGFVAWEKSGSGAPLALLTAGPEDIVDVSTMRAALDDNLQNFLRLELIKEAAAQNASQDRFDALANLQIIEVTADPQGYYRRRLDFYQDRKERYVDLEMRFHEAVGGERTATGSAVLSRAGDWTLMSVSLK